MRSTHFRALPAVALACLVVSCRTAGGSSGTQIIQPGAPGEASRVIPAEKAVDLSQVEHTPADVEFMQGMIGHHAQALEMTALLASRTASDDMKLLAQRIEVSQADEIKMMQAWLAGARPEAARRARASRARRDADAGHAHAGGDEPARGGEGRGVRSAVPRVHDQAPRGRARRW